MMRVAYVTKAPFISGAERALQLILRHAVAAGIEPLVICPPDSLFANWCRDNGILHERIALADRDRKSVVRWVTSVVRVAWALRRHKIDVVHSNQVWSYAAAGAAAGFLNIPRVCHMRDEFPSTAAVQWWCRSGVETVVCISRHIEARMSPAWEGSATRPVIRTMIDPVMLAVRENESASDARASASRRFDFNPSTLVFGFIGQIVAVKGVMELLRAVHGLGRDARWTLLVAGRDPNPGRPYETACRQWLGDHGLDDRVKFVGFLDDVTTFYQSIDVAVVPSLEEPLGLVPLEAAAAGKPTIAFATGGLKETVIHNETGWLVPTGDVAALRDTLNLVLGDRSSIAPRGQMARRWVEDNCEPGQYMRSLAKVYTDVSSALSDQPASVL